MEYEVLNPWAEADPVPLSGIVPRVANLAGKKIGLFRNIKAAAGPILTVVEKKLKERFPTCETSWYMEERGARVAETPKAGFEEWVKGVDAVVAAVGD